MLTFQCSQCQRGLSIHAKHAGKGMKCPGCSARITVPQAPGELSPTPTPATPGTSLGAGGQHLESRVFSVEQEVEGPKKEHKLARSAVGLIVASIVAGIFAVIWLLLVVFTSREFGLLAWAMGALVGLVAGVIARNPSPIYCGLTGAIAGGSVLGAKAAIAGMVYLAAVGLNVVQDLANHDPQRTLARNVVLDQMLADGELQGQRAVAAKLSLNGVFDDYDDSLFRGDDLQDITVAIKSLQEELDARVDTMSEDDIAAATEAVRERHPAWIEDHSLYLAVVDNLRINGDLPTELAVHARHTARIPSAGKADASTEADANEYIDTNIPRDLQQRSRALRTFAAAHIRGLTPELRKQAFKDVSARHPGWISDHDGHYAVMDRLLTEGQLDANLTPAAEQQIAINLDYDWSTVGQTLDAAQQTQLTARVNEALWDITDQERQAAIDAASQRHPQWKSPLGINLGDGESLGAALEELGDTSSYASTFRSTLSGFDFLWLFLAVTSAFSIARKQAA